MLMVQQESTYIIQYIVQGKFKLTNAQIEEMIDALRK